MKVINLSLALASLPLLTWLAVTIAAKKLYRRFPFFTTYALYAIAAGLARTLSDSTPRTYFYVFWGTEPLYALLGLIATYEAFHEIFQPFYRIRWFRPLVYLAALATIGLSLARVIQKPPVQAGKLGGLVLSFEIGVRYIQGGIFALSFLLIKFFRFPARRYPMGILDGFGVTAIGILTASMLRSDFGTRFNQLFSFIPPVVYIIACLIWLIAMRGKENRNGNGSSTPPLPLAEMPGEMKRLMENARKISKHPWN